MNTTELFALIDDWLSLAEDLDGADPGQYELGRATQLKACADQLLKVMTIMGVD